MSDSWWQRVRSWQVAAAFVAYIVFSVLFFMLGPYGEVEAAGGIVDDDLGSNGSDVLDAVAALTPVHDAYRAFLIGDLVYPVLQGLWMAGFLLLTADAWRRLPPQAALLPATALLFDWIENLALLRLLAAPTAAVAWVVVVAMHLKFAAVVAAMIAVVAALVWWITHPVQRRPRRLRPARTRAPGAPGSGGPDHDRRGPRRTREH